MKQRKIFSGIAICIITFCLFLFGQGVRWYAIGGDTEAYYIHFGHHIEAKPLYPLFFHVLKLIFGETRYLYVAAFIQMLVAACCISIFVLFIKEKFSLHIVGTCIVLAGSLIPFWLLLPEDPIPHVLMTESVTYPFLYLYVVLILKGVFEDKVSYMIAAEIWVIFMTLIRGQMLFLAAVTGIVYFIWIVSRKQRTKVMSRLFWLFCFILLSVKAEGLLAEGYEKIFFDAPKQSYFAQTLVQKALYCSDETDETLFDDEIEKEIFTKTYAGMKKEKTLWSYEEKNLWSWKHITASFGANSYLVQDVIQEVLTEHGQWSNSAIEQESNVLDYSARLSKKLVREHFLRCIEVSIQLMPAGFVSTVLFHKASIYGLIYAMTLVLYVMAIGGSVYVYWRNKKMESESVYMMLIVLIAVTNVVSSNLMHFGLQRYLAYTVGMFYIGLFILMRRILWNSRLAFVVRKL